MRFFLTAAIVLSAAVPCEAQGLTDTEQAELSEATFYLVPACYEGINAEGGGKVEVAERLRSCQALIDLIASENAKGICVNADHVFYDCRQGK